jgi:hypothetical protein
MNVCNRHYRLTAGMEVSRGESGEEGMPVDAVSEEADEMGGGCDGGGLAVADVFAGGALFGIGGPEIGVAGIEAVAASSVGASDGGPCELKLSSTLSSPAPPPPPGPNLPKPPLPSCPLPNLPPPNPKCGRRLPSPPSPLPLSCRFSRTLIVGPLLRVESPTDNLCSFSNGAIGAFILRQLQPAPGYWTTSTEKDCTNTDALSDWVVIGSQESAERYAIKPSPKKECTSRASRVKKGRR